MRSASTGAAAVDVHLHLGLLGARGRERGELFLDLLDLAVEIALLHLGVERTLLRVRHARGDEPEHLRPVGRRRRTPRLVLGVRGKLGEIAEELLLRLGSILLALRQRAIVAQLLDLVLEALALRLQRRLVGARYEAALRVDG